MPRKKPRFQSRLSRSNRMRGATVKQAAASNPDRVKHVTGRRGGVEHLDSTAAIDAVVADQSSGFVRLAAVQIGWLVGSMAFVALIVVYLAQQPGQPFGLTPSVTDFLLILAATTGVLGMLIFFKQWHQGRMIVIRLTPEQRRCTLSAGTLRIQDRLTDINSHEHWLRAPGSDWMIVDTELIDGLEPIMEASQRNDVSIGRQTGNDVAREWIVRDATTLFHHHTRTVIEIYDADGDLVYRHPKYRPNE